MDDYWMGEGYGYEDPDDYELEDDQIYLRLMPLMPHQHNGECTWLRTKDQSAFESQVRHQLSSVPEWLGT